MDHPGNLTVTYELHGKVAVITLHRPEVQNAVDSHTAQALHGAFEHFEADEQAHVAVFTGGGGTFCAGADLKALAKGDTRDLSPEAIGPMGPTRMELSKPVIAAIEGYAVAGGLELALFCDMRVVAEDAVFGVFCRRFGVPLIDLGTVRLPRLIGHGRAMDLILTGRPVHADEALRIGLCERVVAKGRALSQALELAAQIAAFPPALHAGRPALGHRSVVARVARGDAPGARAGAGHAVVRRDAVGGHGVLRREGPSRVVRIGSA